MKHHSASQLQTLLLAPATDARRSELYGKLGDRLSALWMRQRPQGVARDVERAFCLRSGEFGISVALTQEAPCLLPGLVIPCCWRATSAKCERLPPVLIDEAERIKDLAIERTRTSEALVQRIRGHHLWLPDDCEDLSWFPLDDAASAGAMLLATIELCATGLTVDPAVTVSATWDSQYGMSHISQLSDKIVGAQRAGVTCILVAPNQSDAYESNLNVEIARVPSSDVTQQLVRLKYRLSRRPDGGSYEECQRWYEFASQSRHPEIVETTTRFYVQQLAKTAAANLDERHRSQPGGTLVIAATGTPEVSVLAAFAHRPKRMIVAVLDDQSKRFSKTFRTVLADSEVPGGTPQVDEIDIDTLVATPPSRDYPVPLCADLTGGNTRLKVKLADWARDHGVNRVCFEGAPGKSQLVTLDVLRS